MKIICHFTLIFTGTIIFGCQTLFRKKILVFLPLANFPFYLFQMAHCHAPFTTSPPPPALIPTLMPLPLNSLLRRVTISSHTLSSLSTPHCPLMPPGTLRHRPLHLRFLPTIYQAPAHLCLSISPLSTRRCSTTCPPF